MSLSDDRLAELRQRWPANMVYSDAATTIRDLITEVERLRTELDEARANERAKWKPYVDAARAEIRIWRQAEAAEKASAALRQAINVHLDPWREKLGWEPSAHPANVIQEIVRQLRAAQAANAELVAGLRKLRNEASSLRAFEAEVREAIGNTNWLALRERVGEVDALLTKHAPTEGEGGGDE